MAAITWSDVTSFAPELTTSVPADAQTLILSYVNTSAIDPASFDGEAGVTTRLARIYLAAHLGSGVGQGASGAAGGPVTSESMGGLSRSYSVASVATAMDATGSTAYGRMYEALVNNSLARLPLVL